MDSAKRRFAFCTGIGRVEGAVLPRRSSRGSAGYDLVAPHDMEIPPGGKLMILTGVKAYMPSDEVLEINVRSSMGVRHDLMLANTIGWVDSDYADNPDNEGCIGVALRNLGTEPVRFRAGDRIAQGRFSRCLFVDDDDPGGARQGGFGSSGR